MSMELQFLHPSTLITTKSKSYRPPCFPPPDDWVITSDEQGNDLSLYGDNYWDYSAFGFHGFNFAKHNLSERNLRLLKQVLLLFLYHPFLFPGKLHSCKRLHQILVKITKVCDTQGILISELSRFPLVLPRITDSLRGASHQYAISYLHKLYVYSDDLGFVIADEKALSILTSEVEEPEHFQTPYIPPRIWSYQINRLNECLDDFIEHQELIENSFQWIADAYIHNKSLRIDKRYRSPFNETHRNTRIRTTYTGGFENYLRAHGLFSLFDKWISAPEINGWRLTEFSEYLNLVRSVANIYILNFSLQRRSEAGSLRSDCFMIEKDLKLGPIGMIVGETTKTDPDDDARWVVPHTVKKAIDVATFIANLRMRFRPEGLPLDIEGNPYLLTPAWEPWAHGANTRIRPMAFVKPIDFNKVQKLNPKLFLDRTITITEKDWKIALSLTPNLDQKEGFVVGRPWPFTAHQLRRTTNVNMFASGMVSDNSLQWQMKQLSRKMTLYYGRNYANLRLNSEVESAVILESYRAIYRKLVEVVEDSVEYVRPHGKLTIPANVNTLVDYRDEKKLTNLIKKGKIGCRRTLLGFCTKLGSCEYGGIESVVKCAGTDGNNICVDVIFERKNRANLIKIKEANDKKLKKLNKDSPHYSKLQQENYAIGVFLDVIN